MANKLTADQAFALSKAFHNLSTALGNFRYDHWDELSARERQELEDKQWTLFNTASDLNARSVVMRSEILKEHLDALKRITVAMDTAAKKIDEIKRGLRIAAKAVAFGGGIASGDVPLAVNAGKELLAEINA
jgi:hypothetical protein